MYDSEIRGTKTKLVDNNIPYKTSIRIWFMTLRNQAKQFQFRFWMVYQKETLKDMITLKMKINELKRFSQWAFQAFTEFVLTFTCSPYTIRCIKLSPTYGTSSGLEMATNHKRNLVSYLEHEAFNSENSLVEYPYTDKRRHIYTIVYSSEEGRLRLSWS